MKKILGLDLGAASIGWALIGEESGQGLPKTIILGLGTRVIPYTGTEGQDFSKGTGETRNSQRTRARTIRRGYDRYQMRRRYLVEVLVKNNMMPGEDIRALAKDKLWELRCRSVTSEVTLEEFGRILLWLNQKRGYKSSRIDANLDKKNTEYVSAVKTRFEAIKELNLTIGQYFCTELKNSKSFHTKDKVFPREAYIEEFNRICSNQQKYHPELTEDLINKIRDVIIYYQRPLKSQKGLVSVCEFEGFYVKKNGKEYLVGPKVAPRSSPLFQAAKIFENINNIRIGNLLGGDFLISPEQRTELFHHLDNNEKLTASDLLRILGLKRNNCILNKQLEKGIQGNLTKSAIKACLGTDQEVMHLLRFDLKVQKGDKEGFIYNRKTGELLNSKVVGSVTPAFENEPLYRLWHTIYSISDHDECVRALKANFKLDSMQAEKLAALDFRKAGFGNKSSKAIRSILPYLIEGDCYSDAMSYAGYDHSGSMTRDENLQRNLEPRLRLLQKNSLRQPVVEKILNQMIHVVNGIIDRFGKPDEIRVELARELKQSREERLEAEKSINKRERENEEIAKHLSEYGLRPVRNNIIKWRLYQEINNEEKKMNAACIYCGMPISLTEALQGKDVDVEHIIPKSRLFDDSQSNKTLAHRKCNKDKNDLTAFEFMKTKTEAELNGYIERVNSLFRNGIIGKSKRDKLLMQGDKIPDNFIDRQLRESQYISRKSREILHTICRNVWTTSGTITSELRRLWGWEDVTMNLQLERYRLAGLTELKTWESDNGRRSHSKEVIKNWTKRDDNRHHAVDALTIACTRQGFIQRFNTLNSGDTKIELQSVVRASGRTFKEKLTLIERYIISQQPISVSEAEKAVDGILISYKPGKKVAVRGKRKTGPRGLRKVVQDKIIVPRGALSEESVYGKIRTIEKRKNLKFLFEHPELIIKGYIKAKVDDRLTKFGRDPKKALASLKNDPIYLDNQNKVLLEYASCFKDEFVIKYPVDINFNKADKVIDHKIKEILLKRLDKYGGKPREAFRDIKKDDSSVIKWYEDEGLELPLRSVRCCTGLSAVVPVRTDGNGRDTGFVKPGNNHHIAIYQDKEGILSEHVCTFWHAVERTKSGIPVILKDTDTFWDKVLESPEEKYSERFLGNMPPPGLILKLSIQQNEMFILGTDKEDIDAVLSQQDKSRISKYLYRVQKIGPSDYTFRHHLETQVKDDKDAMVSKRFYRINSIKSLFTLNPVKVRVDHLGELILMTSDSEPENRPKYQDLK